ncbi:MAG: ribonuclease, partial [Acidobacteriota bacterium]|nr:ribonuclease [Acidobacteriota bacterium]
MSKELVISATRHETRVAVLEEDQLVEIFYQREKEYSLAGSIHKGRVTRVLPGMQSAFVDIGLERDAFLYVSDFFEDNEEYDKIVTGVEEKVLRLEKGLPATVDAPLTIFAEPNPEAEERASESDPVSPVASSSQREPRPERSGDRGGDRQRGGRGRRRGRRSPGMSTGSGNPGGGLPESKYFSPRSAPLDRESQEAVQDSSVNAEYAPSADEMVVLPGESLAKYIAEAPQSALPKIAKEEENLRFEPNPFETLEGPEEEAAPGFISPEVIGHEESEPGDGIHAVEEEREAESETAAQPDDERILSIGEEFIASEEEDGGEQDEDLPEPVSLASEGEQPSSEPDTEEGPEPARIPTSLTATLREQNPRYQHRVSRRMRRKTRSGVPGEERSERPARSDEQPTPELNGNPREAGALEVREPLEVRQPRE